MDSLQASLRKKQPTQNPPYTIEESRGGHDDCGVELDYESDVSGALFGNRRSEEKTHQFNLRVSEDIIAYKLRSESSLGEEERRSLIQCIENLRLLAKRASSNEGDEDEEEEDEKEEDLEEGVSPETSGWNVDVTASQQLTEEWENNQMMEFYEEFLGEDGEENEDATEAEYVAPDELELLYKTDPVFEDSFPEEEDEEKEEEEAEEKEVVEVEEKEEKVEDEEEHDDKEEEDEEEDEEKDEGEEEEVEEIVKVAR
jgi:hypothetical protein